MWKENKDWKQEDNFGQEQYDQEKMCNAMDEYLKQCVDTWKNDVIKSQSDKWETYQVYLETKVPTVPGFVLFVIENKIRKSLSRDTIYRRAKDEKKYPGWKEKMDLLMMKQQERLIQWTMWGTYNPLIGKLLLSQHGIHEKTIVENQDGGSVIDEKDLED